MHNVHWSTVRMDSSKNGFHWGGDFSLLDKSLPIHPPGDVDYQNLLNRIKTWYVVSESTKQINVILKQLSLDFTSSLFLIIKNTSNQKNIYYRFITMSTLYWQ